MVFESLKLGTLHKKGAGFYDFGEGTLSLLLTQATVGQATVSG